MKIIDQPLPYHDLLLLRHPGEIEVVVLHCTELPTLEMAREYGERIMNAESRTGFCGHFYIDRNGGVYRYVSEERIAHHVIGHNQNSIGIELVNRGRYPDWFKSTGQVYHENYSPPQIPALKDLLNDLKHRYPSIHSLARHSDLDTAWIPAEDDPNLQVRRRLDPGPLFPWDDLLLWWKKNL